MTVKIYALINPINAEYFYIGQTVQSLGKRLSFHLNAYSNSDKNAVIGEVERRNEKVEIVLLAEVSKVIADDIEKFLIKKYKKIYHLTNIAHLNESKKERWSRYSKNKTLFG